MDLRKGYRCARVTWRPGGHSAQACADTTYLLPRVGFYLLTAWIAVAINYFQPRRMPGNPSTSSGHATALPEPTFARKTANLHQ